MVVPERNPLAESTKSMIPLQLGLPKLHLGIISELPDSHASLFEWLLGPTVDSAVRRVLAKRWVRRIFESSCTAVLSLLVEVLFDFQTDASSWLFHSVPVALLAFVDALVDAAARKPACFANRPDVKLGLLSSGRRTLPAHASNPW